MITIILQTDQNTLLSTVALMLQCCVCLSVVWRLWHMYCG